MPKKKKQSKGNVSKGERPNVSKETTARMKADRTPAERLAFKLRAALKGKVVKVPKANNWKMDSFVMAPGAKGG